MGSAADRMNTRVLPLLDPADSGTLRAVIDALTDTSQIVDDVARDTDTTIAWGQVLSPELAPAELLPWLALFPGSDLPPSADEAEQRDRISQAAGFYSGSDRAIIEEVQRTLTGAQSVILIHHGGGDFWALTVRTRTSETPDTAATLEAATRQKPAGIILTLVVSDAPVWDEATRTWDAAAAVTWNSVLPADVQ